MEQRDLGRTGLRVSTLGYGAGAVGGLMVRGTPAEQTRAIARALDAGIPISTRHRGTAMAVRRRTWGGRWAN